MSQSSNAGEKKSYFFLLFEAIFSKIKSCERKKKINTYVRCVIFFRWHFLVFIHLIGNHLFLKHSTFRFIFNNAYRNTHITFMIIPTLFAWLSNFISDIIIYLHCVCVTNCLNCIESHWEKTEEHTQDTINDLISTPFCYNNKKYIVLSCII